MDKKVILIGGFHEIIELCEELEYSIIGIIDNNLTKNYLGYPILGVDNDAHTLFEKYNSIPLVITPDLPLLREKLFQYYSKIGFTFESLISSAAKISKSSSIGIGTIIQQGVNVSSYTQIGNFVKLNTGCNIMHDCIIQNFVTVAPNAVVLGRIKIGNNTYIGSNATVLANLQISNSVIIGAGAVVTKNIEDTGSVYVGIPAKKLN